MQNFFLFIFISKDFKIKLRNFTKSFYLPEVMSFDLRSVNEEAMFPRSAQVRIKVNAKGISGFFSVLGCEKMVTLFTYFINFTINKYFIFNK